MTAVRIVPLLVLALLDVAAAAACKPANSCPKLSDNLYCPVNNVTEQGDINEDVAEISKLLKEEPPNYKQAKTVYSEGKYSSMGKGAMRTLQIGAKKDLTKEGKYTNTFYTGAVELYGTKEKVWDELIIACLDNTGVCKGKSNDFRRYVINKGLIGVVTAYVTYEMGCAVWKAKQGETKDTQAPLAWDEAAAFYVGNIKPGSGDGITGKAPGNLFSPYEFNWKRDTDFIGEDTHSKAIPILNYGLTNARGTGYNEANLKKAETAMYKIFAIAAIRSALKYSWKAYGGGTKGFQDKYLAEAYMYWHSAAGWISKVLASNKKTVQEIDAMLDLKLTIVPKETPCNIKTKLESLYKSLGITCAMVGKWKSAPTDSCLAEACNDGGSTATLLSGSTAYVDMCKAVSTASDAASTMKKKDSTDSTKKKDSTDSTKKKDSTTKMASLAFPSAHGATMAVTTAVLASLAAAWAS